MKRTGTRTAACLVAAAMAITGCNPKFYAPNSAQVPLLTEKGEFVGAGMTDGNRGELQLAYAAGAHWGIVANGSLFFPPDDGNGNGGSGGMFEAGAGYLLPLERNFVFETYALAGFGSVENHFAGSPASSPGTYGKLHASLLRFSVQPAFGYKSRYFEAAISGRAGLVNYTGISGTLLHDHVNQQDYLSDHKTQLMLEPALTLRGGIDFLKLQVQVGSSINMSTPDFPQDNGWLTLGLFYRMRR